MDPRHPPHHAINANLMNPRHPRQNFNQRHPRQNFMDPRYPRLFLTHAKILLTYSTHEPTHEPTPLHHLRTHATQATHSI